LGEQFFQAMLDVALVSPILKAGHQPGHQVQFDGGLAKKERSAVGGCRRSGEIGVNGTTMVGCKLETGLGTLCHSESRFVWFVTACVETQLCQI
jgi:hypothetical protein